jgi:hypothetical protein
MTVTTPLMEQLLAEARYHRERYDLYKAKAYGSRPTSPARLRELKRACEFAEARLRQAQSDERQLASVEKAAAP